MSFFSDNLLAITSIDKLFWWLETNSMPAKPDGHFESLGEITRKIAWEKTPVVALLKKGRVDWYSNFTRWKCRSVSVFRLRQKRLTQFVLVRCEIDFPRDSYFLVYAQCGPSHRILISETSSLRLHLNNFITSSHIFLFYSLCLYFHNW